jgi:tRNA(fMet)-specific endonuclease VapC
MNGRFLLDTNIIIALFAKDPVVHEHLANAKEMFIPCIARGELYFGACKSFKIQENLARIDEFAFNNSILPRNTDTGRRYGEIKSRLKEKGQLIPENDIWIAAIAQQHAPTLVTKDEHFNLVENLQIESW